MPEITDTTGYFNMYVTAGKDIGQMVRFGLAFDVSLV
jgi:hypothetical protein